MVKIKKGWGPPEAQELNVRTVDISQKGGPLGRKQEWLVEIKSDTAVVFKVVPSCINNILAHH